MKIVFLSINYWPEPTGIAVYVSHRAEYLQSNGHDVIVYTTYPYYPQWKKAKEHQKKIYGIYRHNNVKIYRSYSYVPRSLDAIKRILHEVSFVFSATCAMAFGDRPDIIIATSPPLGIFISAWVMSKVWHVQYVFDVQDLQPDSAGDLNMLPKWMVNILYKFERMAYSNSAMITTLTEGMRQKIIHKGINGEKVSIIEPKINNSMCELKNIDGNAFRERYALKDHFIVMHSGNMGIKQGLDVVVSAAVMCAEDTSIYFILIGDGADKDRLQNLSKRSKVNNLKFIPILSDAEYLEAMAACDVALISQKKNISEIAFPSKVVSYMASACAVIAMVNSESEIAHVINDAQCGIVVSPESPCCLIEGINKIKKMNIVRLGENGREYASKRWKGETVMKNMENDLLRACRLLS